MSMIEVIWPRIIDFLDYLVELIISGLPNFEKFSKKM